MAKIILTCRDYGWTATFFGVGRMPEDVEIPLPLTATASIADVCAHMRKRFPAAYLFYRDQLGFVSHTGC
jgi:hypothetical protein